MFNLSEIRDQAEYAADGATHKAVFSALNTIRRATSERTAVRIANWSSLKFPLLRRTQWFSDQVWIWIRFETSTKDCTHCNEYVIAQKHPWIHDDCEEFLREAREDEAREEAAYNDSYSYLLSWGPN